MKTRNLLLKLILGFRINSLTLFSRIAEDDKKAELACLVPHAHVFVIRQLPQTTTAHLPQFEIGAFDGCRREDGTYFSKSTKGWFFGFKLHAIVNRQELVRGAIFTPANTDDRDPVLALAWSVDGGIALADLGYRGEELRDLLETEAELLLLTPADAPKSQKTLLSSLRERVETSFSQPWSRFVDLVYSRSWNGLWNTVKLKMLAFNLAQSGLIPA